MTDVVLEDLQRGVCALGQGAATPWHPTHWHCMIWVPGPLISLCKLHYACRCVALLT
jgi:hypothetical protein